MRNNLVLVLIILILGGLFHFATLSPVGNFAESVFLQWENSESCRQSPEGIKLPAIKQAIGSTGGMSIACQSAPFILKGKKLQLEHAGYFDASSPSPTVTVISENNREVASVPALLKERSGVWHKWVLTLDNFDIGDSVYLDVVVKESSVGNWFALRNRAEQFTFSRARGIGYQIRERPVVLVIFSVLFALALWALYLNIAPAVMRSAVAQFCFFLFLSVLFHFRFDAYYYYDAWHVLERFLDKGMDAAFIPHNEHFLPVFFLIYQLLVEAFQEHYFLLLLFGCLLHASNCWLLYRVLRKLFASSDTALFLSVAYLVSFLHAETLQWAFEISILLSQFFSLLAILVVSRIISRSTIGISFLLLFLVFLTPLTFGNGFQLAFALPLFALFFICYRECRENTDYRIFLLTKVVALSAIALGVALLGYSNSGKSPGHGLEDANFFGNIGEVGNYLFVGTQLGTVLRGLLFVPVLELGVARAATPEFFLTLARPEIVFACLGLLVSTLILLLSLYLTETRRAIGYWLLGQMLIVSAFILPALGRWSFGLDQALAIRYQYVSLVGLVICLIPLFNYLFEKKSKLISLIIIVVFSVNIFVLGRFQYFTSNGKVTKNYLASLLEWRELRGEAGNLALKSYEAWGTGLEGLYPMAVDSVTPSRHPEKIVAIYDFIKSGASVE